MLVFFIFFIVLAFWAIHFLSSKRPVIKHQDEPIYPYKKRNRLMNQSEQALYIALQAHLGLEYIILSKVRIEDFVEVPLAGLTKSEVWGWRGRIKSRHIDFLICDMRNTNPVLGIELDGNSHERLDRIERDNFVNGVYKSIDLPISHIKVGDDFGDSVQEIRDELMHMHQV